MKTLNLVNLEQSDIKYKISKFPDGIYCTNSYTDNPYSYKPNEYYNEEVGKLVKQLNVF